MASMTGVPETAVGNIEAIKKLISDCRNQGCSPEKLKSYEAHLEHARVVRDAPEMADSVQRYYALVGIDIQDNRMRFDDGADPTNRWMTHHRGKEGHQVDGNGYLVTGDGEESTHLKEMRENFALHTTLLHATKYNAGYSSVKGGARYVNGVLTGVLEAGVGEQSGYAGYTVPGREAYAQNGKTASDSTSPWTSPHEAARANCILLKFLVESNLRGTRSLGTDQNDHTTIAVGNPRTTGNAYGTRNPYSKSNGVCAGGYTYVTPVRISDANSMMNQITRIPQVYDYLTISDEKLSYLVPTVQIFKIDSVKKGKEDLIEMTLNDTLFMGPRMSRAFQQGDESSAGLKKLEVKYLATNPAEIHTNIEMKLELFFANVKGLDLLRINRHGKKFRWLDLVKRRGPGVGDSDEINQDNVAKIVFGWAIPRSSQDVFTQHEKQAVILQREVMVAYLREHTINYAEDGSVTLSIVFNAATEAVLDQDRRCDLLSSEGFFEFHSSEVSIHKDNKKELRRLQKKRREEQKRSRKAGLTTMPEKSEREKSLESRVKDYESAAMVRAMKRLSSEIIRGGNMKSVIVPREVMAYGAMAFSMGDQWAGAMKDQTHFNRLCGKGKFKRFLLAQKLLSKVTYVSDSENAAGATMWGSDFGIRADAVRDGLNKVIESLDSGYFGFEGKNAFQEKNGKNMAQQLTFNSHPSFSVHLAAELKKGKKAVSEGTFNNNATEETGWALAKLARLGYSGNATQIIYCHFGDIVEAAYRIIDDNWDGDIFGRKGNTAVKVPVPLLGPYTIVDPCNGGIAGTVNIADLPIPFDRIVAWLTNTVVRPKRQTYPLRLFLTDLLTDFLRNTFHNCNYSGYQINGRVDSIIMRGCPVGKGKNQRWTCPDRLAKGQFTRSPSVSGKHGSALDLRSLNILRMQASSLVDGKNISSCHYTLLYSQNYYQSSLVGDTARDAGNGIWHLSLVTDFGPIKDWSFERMDQKYLGEAMTFDDEGPGADYSGGSFYNMTLNLAGTGIFRPGQLVFINAAGLGLGSSQVGTSLSTALHMGGYYLITEVDSFIDDSGYQTKIKGFYQQTSRDLRFPSITAFARAVASLQAESGLVRVGKSKSPNPQETSIADIVLSRDKMPQILYHEPTPSGFNNMRPIPVSGIRIVDVGNKYPAYAAEESLANDSDITEGTPRLPLT